MRSSDAVPVAVVTGAGGGVGRAICANLAGRGMRLIAVGRTRVTLESALRDAGLDDARSAVCICDLGDPEDKRDPIAMAMERFGRIDILINNAGLADSTPFDQTDEACFMRHLGVNLMGPFRLIGRVWEPFVDQGGGRVVNVSSMATVDPFPGLGAYAAAKCALDSLTRTIRNEGAVIGIEAWSVAPGAIETDMLRGIVDEQSLPTEMTLSPKDVAAVVSACAAGERPEDMGTTIFLPSPS